jgi:hypothetical protein
MKTLINNLLTTMFLFFAPVVPVLLSVGLMIVIDTYFGIKAAKKMGIKYNSGILRKGLCSKFISYQSSVLLIFMMDNWIFNELVLNYISTPFLITKILGMILILIEFSSINESSEVLYKKSFKEVVRDQLKSIFSIKKDIDSLR